MKISYISYLSCILEVLDVLIFEETVSENHGQVEDASNRAHCLALLDQFVCIVCSGDVESRDEHGDPGSAPEVDATSLVASADAGTRGEDEFASASIDEPLGQLQAEATQSTGDEVDVLGMAEGSADGAD